MGKRVVDDASLTAVADKIRELSVIPIERVFPDGFINGVQDVYDEGVAAGRREAEGGYTEEDLQAKYDEGKQAEYDRFWDGVQQNGALRNYDNVFSGVGWNMTTFKPKYDIIATACYMTFRSTGITDLGVALGGKRCAFNTTTLQYTFSNTSLVIIDGVEFLKPLTYINTAFQYSSKLREIRVPIPISETATSLNDAFSGCSSLEYVRFTGVIPVNFSFQSCKKLTKASIENIMETLSTTATGKTVTFAKVAVDKAFETSEGANDGSTSAEWSTLVNTRSNWTINLADA